MTDHGHAGNGASRRGLLLIAARAPEPGMTKTRLGATIGMARAAALYTAFLVDLAARFTPHGAPGRDFDLAWAHTPDCADFGRLLDEIGCARPPAVRLVAQQGEGWDVRQANLLRWGASQGYQRTVLMASDSPHVPLAYIRAAFQALRERDVALGRTLDGGYYLIGMRGCHDVLSGVPMSTVAAADALAARVAARGLTLAELPWTFDVDTEADLRLLCTTLARDASAAPATWAALQRLGLHDLAATGGAIAAPLAGRRA